MDKNSDDFFLFVTALRAPGFALVAASVNRRLTRSENLRGEGSTRDGRVGHSHTRVRAPPRPLSAADSPDEPFRDVDNSPHSLQMPKAFSP